MPREGTEETDGERVTVRYVQPGAAAKRYFCPGCEGVIPSGTFHLAVIPEEQPERRRHWHRGCWLKSGTAGFVAPPY